MRVKSNINCTITTDVQTGLQSPLVGIRFGWHQLSERSSTNRISEWPHAIGSEEAIIMWLDITCTGHKVAIAIEWASPCWLLPIPNIMRRIVWKVVFLKSNIISNVNCFIVVSAKKKDARAGWIHFCWFNQLNWWYVWQNLWGTGMERVLQSPAGVEPFPPQMPPAQPCPVLRISPAVPISGPTLTLRSNRRHGSYVALATGSITLAAQSILSSLPFYLTSIKRIIQLCFVFVWEGWNHPCVCVDGVKS